MPLASVTSVEPQRARPVGANRRSFRYSRPLSGDASRRLRARLAERLSSAEHLSLHEEDVEIAVVVVVEQRDARRHDLGMIELARTCR